MSYITCLEVFFIDTIISDLLLVTAAIDPKQMTKYAIYSSLKEYVYERYFIIRSTCLNIVSED